MAHNSSSVNVRKLNINYGKVNDLIAFFGIVLSFGSIILRQFHLD